MQFSYLQWKLFVFWHKNKAELSAAAAIPHPLVDPLNHRESGEFSFISRVRHSANRSLSSSMSIMRLSLRGGFPISLYLLVCFPLAVCCWTGNKSTHNLNCSLFLLEAKQRRKDLLNEGGLILKFLLVFPNMSDGTKMQQPENVGA